MSGLTDVSHLSGLTDASHLSGLTEASHLSDVSHLSGMTDVSHLFDLTELSHVSGMTELSHVSGLTAVSHLSGLTDMSHPFGLIELSHLSGMTQLSHMSGMTDVSHLIDDSLHLHMGHLWQRGLEEVHHTLKGITLQDELPVAAQQHQCHLEDHIWALDEDHICSTHTHTHTVSWVNMGEESNKEKPIRQAQNKQAVPHVTCMKKGNSNNSEETRGILNFYALSWVTNGCHVVSSFWPTFF